MSVQSISSLETTYGSCVGSDAESLVSRRTFKSVRSSSTAYFSGDSDTDTLVNFGGEGRDDGEAFFDVLDDERGSAREDDSADETMSQDLGDVDALPAM